MGKYKLKGKGKGKGKVGGKPGGNRGAGGESERGSTSAEVSSFNESRVVVGLDFGTTFSGFTYISKSQPEKWWMFEDWLGQGEFLKKPYCKTATVILYEKSETGEYVARDWGWPAVLRYFAAVERVKKKKGSVESPYESEKLENSTAGKLYLVKLFKLHLAPRESDKSKIPDLPDGLSVDKAISDYLKFLGEFVLKDVKQQYGKHITNSDIEWAVTVPAMWDDKAKQRMRKIVNDAGLVQEEGCNSGRGSPFPLHIVLEPEAASIYCQEDKDFHLSEGDQFLVVDAGGGTVDIVVQELQEGGRTREVIRSIGELCGSIDVDSNFLEHVKSKIGCWTKFIESYPTTEIALLRQWEDYKCNFDTSSREVCLISIPSELADDWTHYDFKNENPPCSFDEIKISPDEVRGFFDPVVEKILNLIAHQLEAAPKVQHVVAVGGFSSSEYLFNRMKELFQELKVLRPPNPGGAVCVGAALYALRPELRPGSRCLQKTYGISASRIFQPSDPEDKLSIIPRPFPPFFLPVCDDIFVRFVEVHQKVKEDESFKHVLFVPELANQGHSEIVLYSTTESSPKYVTDEGVQEEGKFVLQLPKNYNILDNREIEVEMFFGRSVIEVIGRAKKNGICKFQKTMKFEF